MLCHGDWIELNCAAGASGETGNSRTVFRPFSQKSLCRLNSVSVLPVSTALKLYPPTQERSQDRVTCLVCVTVVQCYQVTPTSDLIDNLKSLL